MVVITWAERKSKFLSVSNLACLSKIPTVNVSSGCAHGCIYCYARGYRSFPGDSKVVMYTNTVEKIEHELLLRKTKPRVVYFSSSSDLFQPIPEILDISHSLLELLFSKGIGVALVTKGIIPERTMWILLQNADMVKAQIGLITHDDTIRQLFEPNAASTEDRLLQMSIMCTGGIDIGARIIPIIPGITDSTDAIDTLLRAISTVGIRRASISTLFLRPAILASIKRSMYNREMLARLLDFYNGSPRMPVPATNSSIIPLARKNRETIYGRFRQQAEKYEVEISVCGCMNPDIGGLCNIAGNWPQAEKQLAWRM